MENDVIDLDLEKYIYKKGHLQLATFFGGPLTAVYILAENYKQLGHPEKVKRTWVIGIGLCLVFLTGVFLLSTIHKTPDILVPLLCILIGSAIMQTYQGADISLHVDAGGHVYSMWRAVIIGIIGLVVTIFIVLIFLFLATTFFGYTPKIE
jgi:hypothetical protein